MSIDNFRRIADRLRAIPGNKTFGLREYTVELNVCRYSGGVQSVGDGPLINISGRGDKILDQSYPITVAKGVPPAVSFPAQLEISWGFAGLGLAIVGPFTPQYSTDGGATVGGVSRDLLDGTAAKRGDIVSILITGPNFPRGCLHRIYKYQVDNPLEVILICLQTEPMK